MVDLEEPGRRGDRGRAAQAGRLPGRARSIRCSSSSTAARPASSRPTPFTSTSTIRSTLGREARSSSSRTIAAAPGYGEKFRSLNVRNLGIGDAWDVAVRHRLTDRAGHGRCRPRRHHGLEPGRLHFGVSHDARQRALQGGLGRRRNLGLDDLLREHRHHTVHAAVPEGDAVGRPEIYAKTSPITYIKGARRRR